VIGTADAWSVGIAFGNVVTGVGGDALGTALVIDIVAMPTSAMVVAPGRLPLSESSLIAIE
jgi:hypothetical protein